MQAPYNSHRNPTQLTFQPDLSLPGGCMSKGLLSLSVWCLICFGFGAVALADEVKLKNGDRLTGAVVKFDGKNLTLKTEFAGTVNIVWDAVDQVLTAQPIYLG